MYKLMTARTKLGEALEVLAEKVKGSDYGRLRTSSEPARRFEAVDLSSTDWTPSEDFGAETRALKIGTGGNLKIDGVDYGTGVTVPVLDGETFPGAVTKVYKTGTTATSIVALAAIALVVTACCCQCPPARDPPSDPPPARCEGNQIDPTCLDAANDGASCCLGPGLLGTCDHFECLP